MPGAALAAIPLYFYHPQPVNSYPAHSQIPRDQEFFPRRKAATRQARRRTRTEQRAWPTRPGAGSVRPWRTTSEPEGCERERLDRRGGGRAPAAVEDPEGVSMAV